MLFSNNDTITRSYPRLAAIVEHWVSLFHTQFLGNDKSFLLWKFDLVDYHRRVGYGLDHANPPYTLIYMKLVPLLVNQLGSRTHYGINVSSGAMNKSFHHSSLLPSSHLFQNESNLILQNQLVR